MSPQQWYKVCGKTLIANATNNTANAFHQHCINQSINWMTDPENWKDWRNHTANTTINAQVWWHIWPTNTTIPTNEQQKVDVWNATHWLTLSYKETKHTAKSPHSLPSPANASSCQMWTPWIPLALDPDSLPTTHNHDGNNPANPNKTPAPTASSDPFPLLSIPDISHSQHAQPTPPIQQFYVQVSLTGQKCNKPLFPSLKVHLIYTPVLAWYKVANSKDSNISNELCIYLLTTAQQQQNYDNDNNNKWQQQMTAISHIKIHSILYKNSIFCVSSIVSHLLIFLINIAYIVIFIFQKSCDN